MRAITAVPATIEEIFQKEYSIPNFQRPYSWESDVECAKLWDDVLAFYITKKNNIDKYFLGNIVVNPSSNPEIPVLEVVDGQQRLITLTLLIKALFDSASMYKPLERCLKILHPLTDEVTDELRLKTYVIPNEMESLRNVILDKTNDDENNFRNNYKYFRDNIDDWKKWHTASEFEKLILFVLKQIVILPINCETSDDALTIFETINNRGKPLEDADIFKAKLYSKVPLGNRTKSEKFIRDWSELEDHNKIFRIYMHILRSKAEVSDHEEGLRSYFDKHIININIEEVTRSLKLISKIVNEWVDDDDVSCLKSILSTHANSYFIYPVYIFMYKYAYENKETGNLELTDSKLSEFITLLKRTIKFVFAKSIIGKTADIKWAAFKAYVKIQHGRDYASEYKLTTNECITLSARLDESQQIVKSCKRGIIYLSAYLNNQQNKHDFAKLLSGKVEIEHILPRAWNNYDSWDEKTHAADIDVIGNLMPLSKKANSSASNSFFSNKKKVYDNSTVQDAKDIIHVPNWTRDRLVERNNEKTTLLKSFFEVNNI
ncbi:MAG: DUF262 domain-containing HNH endonuclease family protein [Defluviitaleaceae bacterium]|nr:DUF262 domain-containing HNH endonuclease family protein [Defluviitaleaceae bacterium]